MDEVDGVTGSDHREPRHRARPVLPQLAGPTSTTCWCLT